MEAYQEERNTKLVAFASRHLCDAILRYSEELQKKNQAKWKKIYKIYEKEILHCKEFSLKTKMKYFVGGVNFSLCRRLMKIV